MRAALYIRVSTQEQASEGYSIDAQKERLASYCNSQEWNVVEWYIEEGESASDLNRPELKRLMSDVQKDLFDVVLVYRLDRLTRSVKDLYKLLETFEEHNVKFRSASEIYDTTSAMGKMFITIVAALAEWELNNLRERVRFGMEQLVREGKWHGGPVPYGYHWDGNMMHIIPEEEVILKELRRIYMSGEGFGSTANILNTRGLKRRDGLPWTDQTVQYTLENPFYAGKIRYGTKKKNGKYVSKKKEQQVPVVWSETGFPTIFTWEEYEEQTARMKKRQFYGTSKRRDYWFAGVLKCGRCGNTLFGRPYRNRGKTGSAINYLCSGRSMRTGCDLPLFRQSLATDMIMDYIKNIKVTQEELTAVAETMEKEVRDNEQEIGQLRKSLKELADRRKKWQYMLAEDLISEADFRQRKREEDEKEAILLERIEELKAEEVGVNASFAQLMYDLPDHWSRLEDGDKKEIMQTIFHSIVIDCDVKTGQGVSKKGQSLPFRILEVNFN